ncbi:MAG: hypothetical protein LBR26_14610 [Prevotella sp.]|jgi:hypothetical protein|nr:hypothetical protein [Prevotella sp.]
MVKNKTRKILTFLLAVLALSGCEKETITPTRVESAASKFDFPQGTSPSDDVIKDIYEKYGVKLIYKDFTQKDMDRAWKSPEGESFISTRCDWKYLDVDTQLDPAISILQEKVFGLLPENVVRAALRSCPYIYVADDIHYITGSRVKMSVYPVKALDSWTVSLGLDYQQPDNYSTRVVYPAQIMLEMFVYAYVEGAITMPSGFFDGLDTYGMTITSRNEAKAAGEGTLDYQNYWARRGFLPFISPESGRIFTGPSSPSCSINVTPMHLLGTAAREIPQFFLFLCLDTHWKEYFEPGNIFEDCPKLQARLDMFNNRMKDVYGIDFDVIREKLYENSTVDRTPDRYAATSDSGNPSFIYGDY